jgi:hypothetical protein
LSLIAFLFFSFAFLQEHQSLRTHTSVAEHILRVTKGSNFHKQLSAEQGTVNKVTRHDTTRHDTTRHDTTRHDTTRHDTLKDGVGVVPAYLFFLLSDLLLGNNPPNDYIEECISRQEPLVKV